MIPTIGNRLKELRQSRKLRQDQVADMIGVTKSAMSAYENGMRQPSYDVLVCLARLFRVSTDYLLGVSEVRSFVFHNLSEHEIDVILELVDMLSKKKE